MIARDDLKEIEKLEEECLKSRLYAWTYGIDKVDSNPWLFYICPTNVCNHKCYICARYANKNKKGFMNLNLFKKIVDQLPDEPIRVYLMKQGEPLLHPKITEMLKYLKETKPNAEVAIHTNGSVLDEERAKAILKYADFFSLSIFSINRETYAKIHGRDDFERVIKNAKKFLELKRKVGRDDIKLYIDYVQTKKNANENLNDVIKFFKKELPDFNIGIHWVFNFLGYTEEGNLRIYNILDFKKFPHCVFPWVSMTILWNGLVSYCFVEPEEQCFLGDANKDTLENIWNNDLYRKFRKLMFQKRFDELEKMGIKCRYCSWLWGLSSQSIKNLVGIDYTKNNKNLLSQPLVNGFDFLKTGLKLYLRGDIERSYYYFNLADYVSADINIKRKARFWKETIENYIRVKYKYIEEWEDLLKQEGKSLKIIHVTKYF